ncbi:MAG: AAA family ATPase [Moraxella sp.]|nr:AAA family ATPase [Moraxella sp.]
MNKIEIKDLKGVGDVELTLDSGQRVFVFLGTNGVGKTKILETLCIALLMFVENFQSSFDEWNENVAFFSSINILNSRFKFETINYGYKEFSAQISEKSRNYYSAFVYIGASQRSDVNNIKESGHYIRILPPKNPKQISELITSTIFDGLFKKLGMSENIHDWFTERAKSVNPYQKEEDNRKTDIDSVLDGLNKIDNRIDKFLSIDGNGNVYLKIDGKERELSELSSGFLSLVKMIQSIVSSYSAFTSEKDLLNIKGVVLIDEIESHLHLEWQVKIIPILKNLFPNTTFYITTHSPLVLSHLNEGETYLLKKDNDGIVRSEMINSPNTRLLENVLQDAFGVNLNQLTMENIRNIDQSKAKTKLLDLLGG